MYKKLVIRLWQFLRFPANAWKMVSEETDTNKTFLSEFFYPLIGLAALTAFVSAFIDGDLTFREKLTEGIQLFVVSFGSAFIGLFMSAKILDWMYVRWFEQPSDYTKAQVLTVYALAPVLAVSILTRLISELFFLKILFLYAFVIIWEAGTQYYTIDTKKQGTFTAVSGIVILFAPLLVEYLLKLMLPGLN